MSRNPRTLAPLIHSGILRRDWLVGFCPTRLTGSRNVLFGQLNGPWNLAAHVQTPPPSLVPGKHISFSFLHSLAHSVSPRVRCSLKACTRQVENDQPITLWYNGTNGNAKQTRCCCMLRTWFGSAWLHRYRHVIETRTNHASSLCKNGRDQNQALDLCFVVEQMRGFFLTQGLSRVTRTVRPPNKPSQRPFHKAYSYKMRKNVECIYQYRFQSHIRRVIQNTASREAISA